MTQDSLQRHQFADQPEDVRAPARMTGRGAVLAMFVIFFVSTAAAGWLHIDFLVGLGLVAGCALAVRFAKRSALLAVVITPPVVFLTAVICAEILTSSSTGHHGLLSVAEGTILTLAAAAPWLFGSVVLSLVIALFRGLPQCVRELREGLRG